MFQDVTINNEITSIEIQLRALEKYISLSEIKLFIGRDSGDFKQGNIVEDSARTWLVPDISNDLEFDYLQISGSAHVGILQLPSFNRSMIVNEVIGDHTGSLHVGAQQIVNISEHKFTVLPFNVQTYKVRISQVFNNVF